MLDRDLVLLYEREERGERVDLAIKNKQERKRRYEEALERLKKEIEQEVSLTISMPKFLGAVIVRPTHSKDMVSDKEIEKIGMKIAMEYEKRNGRVPEDVSRENLGFDIRSKDGEKVRYIEVKARAGEGPVVLTTNEWLKAKRFREDYWLYVISNASTKPELYIIRNPYKNLKVKEKLEVVRFIVPWEEWKSKGARA